MNKSMVIKGLAVAAILFFFLPFFTIACSVDAGVCSVDAAEQDLVTMNGIKLVTGVKYSEIDVEGLKQFRLKHDQSFFYDQRQKDLEGSDVVYKGNFAAILLVLIPIGILVVSFMKLKNNEIMIIIAAAVCFFLVFYLRGDAVNKATYEMKGYISVKNHIGYYLTILVHLGMIGFVVYDKFIAKMIKKPAADAFPPLIPSDTVDQP